MCTTHEVQRRKNEDSAKIITVKKITMMQQRSTGRCSTVDSRRRLTNFKMSVSQCQQSRDSLSHNCQMLNQVLIIDFFLVY